MIEFNDLFCAVLSVYNFGVILKALHRKAERLWINLKKLRSFNDIQNSFFQSDISSIYQSQSWRCEFELHQINFVTFLIASFWMRCINFNITDIYPVSFKNYEAIQGLTQELVDNVFV